MGKINEYSAMGAAPASNDLLFIGDTDGSPAYEIKSITVANLHKVANVAAASSSGLSLKDDGGNYGIFIKDGGNIGIGTGAGSPNTFLELNSGARTATFVAGTPSTWTNMLLLNPTDTNTAAVGINFQVDNAFDSGSGAGIVGIKSHATNAQMDLAFITDPSGAGSAERIRILHSGEVGVGQTAPTSLLHVGDGSATPSLRIQGSSHDVYLYTDATNGPGVKSGSGDELHLQKGYGGGSNTDLVCFYSTSDPVTPLMIQSVDGNVGIGTNDPSATLEISSKVDDALYIYSRDSAKSARIHLETASGSSSYIQDVSTGYVAIGGTSSLAASNCLQIAKANGRISIGGTLGTFNYAVTTSSLPATQAYFSSSSTAKGYIYITNTQSATCQTAVVFGNQTETNKARWMCGQFWNTSHNYFGFEYLGDASKTPETATFNGGTLQDTTVYISQDGGISAENTAAAFGTALGNLANPLLSGGAIVGTGQYNVASAAIKTGYTAYDSDTLTASQTGNTVTATSGTPFTALMVGRTLDFDTTGTAGHITSFTSTSEVEVSVSQSVTTEGYVIGAGNVVTVTFTKDLNKVGAGGPNYTIVASGYDGVNDQVMWGEATDRSTGSCDITFQTAGVPVPNLTRTAVKWTWVIHGAKLKAS